MTQLEIAKQLSKLVDKSAQKINRELTACRLNLRALPIAWEKYLLRMTGCSSKDRFCYKVWKIPFESDQPGQALEINKAEIARRALRIRGTGKFKSIYIAVITYLNGRLLISPKTQKWLLPATQCADIATFQKMFPKAKFSQPQEPKTSFVTMTREIIRILDEDQSRFYSRYIQLLSIVAGKTILQDDMESALLKVTGCADRAALQARFPEIRFQEKPQDFSVPQNKKYQRALNSRYRYGKTLTQMTDELSLILKKKVALSRMSKVFTGQLVVPCAWEQALLQVVGCNRRALKSRYPKIRFTENQIPKPDSLNMLACRLGEYFPDITELTRRERLQRYISGRRPMPPDWEKALLAVTGHKRRSNLRRQWPKMRFDDLAPDQIIVNIINTTPGANKSSIRTLVVKFIKGKRQLSSLWQERFLTATGLKTREELKTHFPEMIFLDE